jgi:hypothetical protein
MGCWIRIFDVHDAMKRLPYRHEGVERGEQYLCGAVTSGMKEQS